METETRGRKMRKAIEEIMKTAVSPFPFFSHMGLIVPKLNLVKVPGAGYWGPGIGRSTWNRLFFVKVRIFSTSPYFLKMSARVLKVTG